MRKIFTVLGGAVLFVSGAFAGTINGAGSSAVAPLIQAWAKDYAAKTGVKVNYQPVGSGAGVRMVSQRMVDFGATDAPLTADQLKREKLIQFPVAAFGTVFAYNLPGVDNLKLSTDAVCGIFSGKVRYWDDPLIAKSNPGVKLPHLPVLVVVRADKSGTTYTVTSYLVKACGDQLRFKKPSKKPNWGIRNVVAAKGNAGVAAVVQKKKGTLGYVEYTYAVSSGLKSAELQNRAGRFVKPSLSTFAEALKSASWNAQNGFYADLTYGEGENTYPIVGATWALVPEDGGNRSKEVVKFFNWAYDEGDQTAKSLGYAPVPQGVKEEVKSLWQKKLGGGN